MLKYYYTNERNVQIVIALLKAHNIRKVIASPGTTNMTFVASIQQDDFFEVYSSVDERSAAYMACGIAGALGEPVVLTCTGATASRNYMSGLTEAYYRKLPILAITSHRGDHAIGHLLDQQIDRRQRPSDIVLESVTIPLVKDENDEQYCIIEANKAILALKRKGGGPAHINMFTSYSSDFSVKELPYARTIFRYSLTDELPTIPEKCKVAVLIGSHKPFGKEDEEVIDDFCASYNAVVFCDHTSGYKGRYRIDYSLVCAQQYHHSDCTDVDLLIHIGGVISSSFGLSPHPKEVWRVNEDGELRDTFRKLTKVFEMPESIFFIKYKKNDTKVIKNDSYFNVCKKEYLETLTSIPELPFGNIWIAKTLHDRLPNNSTIHFGILNSLRSWNFFELHPSIKSSCNVGGFGIDGGLSTLVGASLAEPNRLHFGVFGDLAFFYDMNVLGNRHVSNNLRILLVNNGKGSEFRLVGHPCHQFGESADLYMAAAGHFGQKSQQLVKHYAEDLGFIYLTASTKNEFMEVSKLWLCPNIKEKPVLLEVFTNSKDESDALEKVIKSVIDDSFKNKVHFALKKYGGDELVGQIKKIIKK